jgi:hypothetical protein
MNKENNIIYKLSFAIIFFVACHSVMANTKPNFEFTAQQITHDSADLPAGVFFASFISPQAAHRDQAMFYLLGTLDTSEKKSWCSYKNIKITTLREYIFEYFKKIPAHRMKERASKIIEEALRESFPCGKKK